MGKNRSVRSRKPCSKTLEKHAKTHLFQKQPDSNSPPAHLTDSFPQSFYESSSNLIAEKVTDKNNRSNSPRLQDLFHLTKQALAQDLTCGEGIACQLKGSLEFTNRGNFSMASIQKCPVCYEIYDKAVKLPICLPCGHTLCRPCLSKVKVSPGRGMCPYDRREFFSAIDFLPVNYALLEAAEEGIGIRCPSHGLNIVGYCQNDQKLLCGKCLFEHKNHEVFDLESSEARHIVASKFSTLSSIEESVQYLSSKWTGSMDQLSNYSKEMKISVMDHISKLKDAELELMKKIHMGTMDCIEQALSMSRVFPDGFTSSVTTLISSLENHMNTLSKFKQEFNSMSLPEQLGTQLPEPFDAHNIPTSVPYIADLNELVRSPVDYEKAILTQHFDVIITQLQKKKT